MGRRRVHAVVRGLLLAGGALAERLGGRPVFTGGVAVLVPSSLVLLQAAYPTRAGRSRALGVWGSVGGIGAAIGLVSARADFTNGLHLGIVLAALAFFAGAAVTVTGVGRLAQEPANTPSPSVRE